MSSKIVNKNGMLPSRPLALDDLKVAKICSRHHIVLVSESRKYSLSGTPEMRCCESHHVSVQTLCVAFVNKLIKKIHGLK